MVSIKRLSALLFIIIHLFVYTLSAQTIGCSISGNVKSVTGEILSGASVILKGTNIGTITDANGNFNLRNIKPGSYKINISFQGYKSIEKEIILSSANADVENFNMEESVFEMGEVVVTTQKRQQTSLEVPIAINALAGKTLEKLNVTEFDALAQYIPGLQMQLQSPNNPGFVIRGITSDDGDARVQPRVSVFQDGVSISRARGAVVELFDMERVEVVKGPQGTLFGRSAQIGAVHLIENKPVNSLGGELKLGYGNYNQIIGSGFLNAPIVKGKLLNRLAVSYNKRDGYIKNLSGGNLNGKNTFAIRDIIRLTPSDKTIADLIMNFQYDDCPGTSFKSGTYAPLGGDTDPNTFADLEQGKNLYVKRKVGGVTLHINQNLNENLNLSSISAFRRFYSDESFDADGTAAPSLWFSEIAQGNQISQELRLNYDGHSKFSGFLGASFFYEDGSQRVPLRTNEQSLYTLLSGIVATSIKSNAYLTDAQKTALAGAVYYPMVTDGIPNYVTNIPNISSIFGSFAGAALNTYHEEEYANYGTTRAYEIFADGTYKLTDKLSLTAGIRGTIEHLIGAYRSDTPETYSALGAISGLYPNILSYVTNQKVSLSKDYISAVGRLALNYMFDRNNIYASVSRGRRPGVIDISTDLSKATLDTSFLKPEIVWNYEAGIKGILFNGLLNYDFTTYFYDWNHFQTTIYETGSTKTIDAGKAHSFGIETGLKYNFFNGSNVFVNYGFIDGKFDDKDADGNPQEYAGNTFRLTPKHTVSAGVDLNIKISEKDAFYIRPNYTYKSKVYFEDDNTDLLSQNGFGLVNLTAGVNFVRKTKLNIGLFAKNLLDKKHIIDAGNTGNAFGIPTFIGGSRRTIGIEAKIGI